MYQLFSPGRFFRISRFLLPISGVMFVILLIAGGYFAFYGSPADYQQGDMVRIMYVHVPAAWMSLGVYSFVAICSLSCLVWKTKMSYIFAVAAAPIGAGFALVTLITGSIWGKPIWGTWWVWDARLTSMLILFFIYLGYIAITGAPDNVLKAEKPASVMAIIGFINIPIVKFSVDIWYSLHQPASVFKPGGSSIHPSMMIPLLTMLGCFIMYFIFVLLIRVNFITLKIKHINKLV